MSKIKLWENTHFDKIIAVYNDGTEEEIGYINDNGDKVYYGSSPSATSPKKFYSDWNQRQYDAYKQRQKAHLAQNGRLPDFGTLLYQHNRKVLKGASDLMKQAQARQQALDKEVLESKVYRQIKHQNQALLLASVMGSSKYGMMDNDHFAFDYRFETKGFNIQNSKQDNEPAPNSKINYVIAKGKQDIWNIAKSLLSNNATNAQINDFKNNIVKWNKLNINGDIVKGQRLIVSDPNQPLLIGKIGTVGTGEDSKSSIGGLPKGSLKLPGLSSTPKDKDQLPDEYFTRLYISVSRAATTLKRDDYYWNMSENIIYEKFLSKKGGVNIETFGISKEMEKTDVFKKLKNQISGAFMSQMINNNGDYYRINISNIPLPSFGSMKFPHLLALVGGTQQMDIYLNNIIIYGREYIAEITIWLWDDYGVSEDDTIQSPWIRNSFIPVNDALKSQWILQHNRGYKPLINGFKFTITIKGKF